MLHGYLVVEGPHDTELVGRLLRSYGLNRVRLKSDLDPFWERLIPPTFPVDDDLLKRVPVPTFFQSPAHSVAVHSAIGDTRISATVEESLAVVDAPDALAVILDADIDSTPSQRFAMVKQALEVTVGVQLPDQPGRIFVGQPRSGVFVIPDNNAQGTLEDLLLECADINYAGLLSGARTYVAGVDPQALSTRDRVEFQKRAGQAKATVACVASILKPGKSVQVSIQDNRWLDGAALTLPRIAAIRQFLATLLQLPPEGA